jgi:hypothetical protein
MGLKGSLPAFRSAAFQQFQLPGIRRAALCSSSAYKEEEGRTFERVTRRSSFFIRSVYVRRGAGPPSEREAGGDATAAGGV